MSESVLATYYLDTEFLKWIVDNKFVQHNADNIAKYYSVYQKLKLCRENLCRDCAGLYPTWGSEFDIVRGLVRSVKCAKRAHEMNEAMISKFSDSIPSAFEKVEIDNLDRITPAAKATVKQYIDLFPNNPLHGLYIYGQDHQIGKTSVLWYIAKQLVYGGKITRGFILHTTVIFIDELQADMMSKDHLLMHKARTCDILLLDDFGSEKATQWSQAKLKAIIEERIWHKRDTVLASCIPLVPWMWTTKAETEMLSKINQTMQTVELAKSENKNGEQQRPKNQPSADLDFPAIGAGDDSDSDQHRDEELSSIDEERTDIDEFE